MFVQLRGGLVHEDDDTWGISHLVEHMVFRGTDRHKDVRALTLTLGDLLGELVAERLQLLGFPNHTAPLSVELDVILDQMP